MSNDLQKIARDYAAKAIEYDKKGQVDSAIFYYLEASQSLIDLKQRNINFQNNNEINSKLKEYLIRAENLKKLNSNKSSSNNNSNIKSEFEKDIEKGKCILSEALDEDADGNVDEAFDIYTKAVDFFLKIVDDNQKNHSIRTNSEENLFKQFQKNIENALRRAEEIKQSQNLLKSAPDPPTTPLNDLSLNESNNDSSGKNNTFLVNNVQKSSTGFTKEEIDVLRHGSFINGRDYVPFFPEVDSKEKFFFPVPFGDKDGKLQLSPSQKENFSQWVRPDEIYENPTLMMVVSSFSVKQTCISDCSFVASLTVCAQYERKFNKNILSKIIYPQNKKGEPVFNPCGKYMISLTLNGCARKVIIDDYLPVDRYNELLCSKSTNRGELWVSLLEKAYMKVMGGYDFPGSNSNIDLHALTNWIPERLAIHAEHSDFNADKDFERMFERLHSGDVLITVATGHMNKDEEDRSGLVSTHAYAVLDIRKVKEKRLFQLKNPWSHIRWKGKFSEYDVTNWTTEIKSALNYDPQLACNVDNGIFWIDYESLMKFFDVFYLSWNPSLFPFTSCFHGKWSKYEGPTKDRYNLSENPQYVLRIKPNNPKITKCTTWVLLTRHITDKADFAENKEYITLVVYKNNGKRVYYPMEPPPYKEGVRINSPHYLVKLVDDCSNSLAYTLVISQYEKNNSIYYTLRSYSTMPFQMNELNEPYNSKFFKMIKGKWQGSSAGGCSNNPSYKNNPTYEVILNNNDINNCVKVELKGPQQYSVGFDFICDKPNGPISFKETSTGDFRKGYCVLTLDNLPGGIYKIRPCTYLANQEGPFFLEISSTHEFKINLIN